MAHAVLRRVLRQLDAPQPPPRLAQIMSQLRELPDVERLLGTGGVPGHHDAFVPLVIDLAGLRLNWLTTLLTIGGAVDVTVDALVIECFFPADAHTECAVREQGASPSGAAC